MTSGPASAHASSAISFRRRAPSEPPKTRTAGVSAARPRRARASSRSTARDAAGMGLPTARYLAPWCGEREGEEHAVGERRREPVGQPEMRVGLGDRARDPAQARREDHRAGDVAACSEHGLRPSPVENPQAGSRGGECPSGGAHERRTGPAREPRDREGVELVPELRNEPRFDAIRRPGEGHQSSPPPQRLRHGQRRRDVSDRPAGRYQEPQLPLVRHYARC